MDGKVSEADKERRWQEVMDLQAAISQKNNEALIGTIQRVMIEGTDSESGKLAGRTQAHAPEVDGLVFVDDSEATEVAPLKPGDLVDVKIIDALEYDLMGETLHA
jgi:ribosomal protein S12 methylthiotransferase